jgi:hypothetical protein
VTKLHWNGLLVLLPLSLTIGAFLVVLAGIWNSRTPGLYRATALAYLVFFCIVGKSFDEYGGYSSGRRSR